MTTVNGQVRTVSIEGIMYVHVASLLKLLNDHDEKGELVTVASLKSGLIKILLDSQEEKK